MQEPTVVKQYMTMIIPFAYQKPFASACQEQMDAGVFESKEKTADRLFDYAEHLVSGEYNRNEAIGRLWSMKQGARKSVGLPSNYNQPITCSTKQKHWIFYIREVELYLFETQVGFLLYHIQFPNKLVIDEQIEAVYYLKKLMNFDHHLTFEQRLSINEAVSRDLQLSDISLGILRGIDPVTFFEGTKGRPTEALVFSAVLLDSLTEADMADRYLFHMRRSFKATYKPSGAEQNIWQNPDLLRLFGNSCWGISSEGLANMITRTGDAGTDEFFINQYFSHIQNTYTYLYLLILHQKFALLYLSIQASHISHELDLHENDPGKQSEILTRMKDRIVKFMLRSSYKQVSRSTHHAALYEWMRNRLKIDDLFKELHETMEALAALTESAEQNLRLKEEERKSEQRERFNKKISGISAIFLPLTVITGIYGMDVSWLDCLKEPWLFVIMTAMSYLLTYVLFRWWFNKDN